MNRKTVGHSAPASRLSSIDYVTVRTAFGRFGVAASDRGLVAIFPAPRGRATPSPDRIARIREIARRIRPGAAIRMHREAGPMPPSLASGVRALHTYCAGRGAVHLPRLDLGGTAFQRSVWKRLLAIPRGGTTSYSAIARAIGRPTAARAVGAAVGSNPVTILVPCHRVVGASGALTGFAWGLPMKRALLAHERRGV